jgi:hypothetical protein
MGAVSHVLRQRYAMFRFGSISLSPNSHISQLELFNQPAQQEPAAHDCLKIVRQNLPVPVSRLFRNGTFCPAWCLTWRTPSSQRLHRLYGL